MADRIVWFHGPSGAGKCTLVNQIEIDSRHPVRHRLSSQTFSCCVERDSQKTLKLGILWPTHLQNMIVPALTFSSRVSQLTSGTGILAGI